MKYGQRFELGGRRPFMRSASSHFLRKRQNVTILVATAFVAAILIGWNSSSKQHRAVTESHAEPLPLKVEQQEEPLPQPQVEAENKPTPEQPHDQPREQTLRTETPQGGQSATVENEEQPQEPKVEVAAIPEQQGQTEQRDQAKEQSEQQPHQEDQITLVSLPEEQQKQLAAEGSSVAVPADGSTGTPTVEAMVQYFSEVLLVVSFDSTRHRMAKTILPLLKYLYGRIFMKLAFVATDDIEGHRVDRARPRPTMPTDHGLSLNYGKLVEMPNQYTGIEGILWIDCDTILNYWNLLNADKSLVWYPNLDASKFDLIKPDTKNDWLEEEHWQNKLRETLNSIDPDTREALKANLAEVARRMMIDNPGEIVATRGPYQIFYVPAKHFSKMQTLLDIMHSQGIPAEVAIPTMIFGLETPFHLDKVLEDADNLQNVHSIGHMHAAMSAYKPTASAFWPWPFKPEGSLQELLSRMVQGDPGIQPLLDTLPRVPPQAELAKQAAKGPFVKVVLVLSYDKPEEAQKTENLYRTIYGPYFRDIVYIAKQPLPEDAKKVDLPLVLDSMSLNYGYLGLVNGMSDTEGMLFLSADTVFNHWNAEDADRNKIWLPGPQTRDSAANCLWAESGQWGSNHWSSAEKWQTQIEKAMALLPEDAKAVLRKSFAQLEKALPTVHTGTVMLAATGPSHLFYVPARLFPRLKHLSEIFVSHFIPAEVAIPTICLAMETPEKWDDVLDTFVQIAEGDERPPLVAASELYDVKAAGLRPWPFHLPKSQKALLQKMVRGDPDLESHLRNWDA